MPRITVRRLMLCVALAALAFSVKVMRDRADSCRKLAEDYAFRQQECRAILERWEGRVRTFRDESARLRALARDWPPDARAPKEEVALAYDRLVANATRNATWIRVETERFGRLARHYEVGARLPWLPILPDPKLALPPEG